MAAGEVNVNKYVIRTLDDIGHGEFGSVYLAHKKGNEKTLYAAEKLVVGESDEDSLGQIKFLGHGRISHENIIKLHDYYFTGKNVWIIYELAKGDLLGYFKSRIRSLYTKIHITKQTLEAVTFLHSRCPPILHRSITPSYILFFDDTDKPYVKLAGFARAIEFTEPDYSPTIPLDEYMAPECHTQDKWSLASDIFSVAMVMLALLQHNDPQKKMYPRSVKTHEKKLTSMVGVEMANDKTIKVIALDVKCSELEKKYRKLISEMATYDAKNRLSAIDCQTRIKSIAESSECGGSSTTP